MHPILWQFDAFGVTRPVGSYGTMLAVAMLVGGVLACRAAHRVGIDWGAAAAAVGFVVGGSLAGSYGLFVVVEWFRTGDPVAALSQGGLVFFGAPLGGLAALFVAAPRLGVPLLRFGDAAIHALPAAHALGRLGCFFGGCCFGREWDGPLSVTYAHPLAPAAYPPVPRHPVPLYESLGLLLLSLAFALWRPRRVGDGTRVLAYFAAYGVLRLSTEGFRGDAVRGLYFGGAVSTSQLLSIALIFGCGVGLALLARRAPPSEVTP